MLTNTYINRIKTLIKDGVNLETISFRFGVSIEILQSIKEELINEELKGKKSNQEGHKKESNLSTSDTTKLNETKEAPKKSTSEAVKIEGKKEAPKVSTSKRKKQKEPLKYISVNTKMERMRAKYYKLYYGDDIIPKVTEKIQTEVEKELIDSVIITIEKIVDQIDNRNIRERRMAALNIFKKLDTIRENELTINQAEKIIELLNYEPIQKLNTIADDRYEKILKSYKKIIIEKLLKAIDIEQSKTSNIEELEQLEKKITFEMAKTTYLSATTVKNRIARRLKAMKDRNIMEKIKSNISARIETIIKELVEGTLNIEEAKKIIAEEVESQNSMSKQTKFSLTSEQQKNKILMQIRIALKEKGEKYAIQDYEKTLKKLEELFSGDFNLALTTVVMNFIDRKEFKKAKQICNKYYAKEEEAPVNKTIKLLKIEIRNSEIGDMVIKGLQMNASAEEEQKYIELLGDELKKGNIDMRTISLGKSQDGLRTIHLSDIWEEDRSKSK